MKGRARRIAPPRRQSVADLRKLQQLTFSAISLPLGPGMRTRKFFRDGRPMREVAGEFIKPNDRLTSLERLSLYNQQYWFRLLDVMWDDYPGLRAVLGVRRFEKLRVAYLDHYPSRSFTLRNLGSRLEMFLHEHPELSAPRQKMALDMARFEWAQIVAFDGPAKPPLSVDDLLGQNPEQLGLALQPYITILELDYPLEDFVIAVKKRNSALRGEASNAVETDRPEPKAPAIRLPRPRKTFLAVHRHHFDIYYRRLEPGEFRILSAICNGATLADACVQALDGAEADESPQWSERISHWFRDWAALGWFCKR